MAIEMQAHYWGDEYVSGSYVTFLVNDKVIWESSWAETSDPDELRALREEVQQKLDEWDYVADLKSYDPHEWKML